MAERDPFASMSSIGDDEALRSDRPKGDGSALYWPSVVGVAVGVWVGCWPAPHSIAVPVAFVTPAIALIWTARSNGRLMLALPTKLDTRPSLALMLFPPMIGLGFFAYRSVQFFYWTLPVWVAAAAALVAATLTSFAISRADRAQMSDGVMMFLSGVAAFMWMSGLLAEVNAGPPRNQVFEAGSIVDKIQTSGRRVGSEYEIVIRTLDGQFEERFPVDRFAYRDLEEGDLRCIVRRQGALRIWWKGFQDCPTAGTAAP